MPDKWEYPWFAAWDLAFHTHHARARRSRVRQGAAAADHARVVHEPQRPAARLRVELRRRQPAGARARRARRCSSTTARRDHTWLERIFHKMLLGFTWWANVKDPEGDQLFGGGFLGMDNVGPFDRSAPLPPALVLEQADGTGWMALYCLSMLEIALVLAAEDPAYEDVAVKFFEHFAMIVQAINEQGLWDEDDGFYYDQVRRSPTAPRAGPGPVDDRAASRFCAVASGTRRCPAPQRVPRAGRVGFLPRGPEYAPAVARRRERDADDARARRAQPAAAHSAAARRRGRVPVAARDPRAVGRVPRAAVRASRTPAPTRSSTTSRRSRRPASFGGNSNWRGPIWFPVNYLVIGAMCASARALRRRSHRRLPDTGRADSGRCGRSRSTSRSGSSRSSSRARTATGRCSAGGSASAPIPRGATRCSSTSTSTATTARGLGASHQTGWTGLVADLVIRLASEREAQA